MACMNCATSLIITDKFCTQCGADLRPQHVSCPNGCGFSYVSATERLNFCPQCGAQMPEKETQES